jgi:hypothetical protein
MIVLEAIISVLDPFLVIAKKHCAASYNKPFGIAG